MKNFRITSFFYVVVMLCLVAGTAQATVASQWRWLNPLPCGYNNNDVTFASTNVAVAVGNYGTILRSGDAGVTWEIVQTDADVNFTAVDFGTPTHGMAVGNAPYVWRTTDLGLTWTKTSLSGPYGINGLQMLDENNAWIASDGGLYRTADGGMTWTLAQAVSYPANIRKVQFFNAEVGYAAGYSGTFLKTTDGGDTWTQLDIGTTDNIYDVHFMDADTGLISLGYFMWRTTDGGLTWNSVVNPSGEPVTDFFFKDAQNGAVAGIDADICTTTNGGLTWTRTVPDSPERVYFGAYSPAGVGLAVGNYGIILRSEDHWATWADAASGPHDNIWGMDFITDDLAVAVGENGLIMRTTDAGESWDQLTVDYINILRAVHFGSPQVGLAVGEGGAVFRTGDAGLTWERKTPAITAEWKDVKMRDADLAIAVGRFGRIQRSDDGGNTWTLVNSLSSGQFNRVCFLNDQTVIAVGNDGAIRKSTDAGLTWAIVNSGSTRDLYDIEFWDENTGYITGYYENLKTSDGGDTWTIVDNSYHGFLKARYLSQDVLVATHWYGKMAHSTDGGDTWNIDDTGAVRDYSMYCLNITADGVITVAGDAGTIRTGQVDLVESYSQAINTGFIGWVHLGDDVRISIHGVTAPGTITLNYRTDPSQVPSGFTLLQDGVYLDIVATFEFEQIQPYTLYVDYDETQVSGDETDLALWHYDSTLDPPAWVNITTQVWDYDNTIEGAVTSFSPFMVMEPGVAVPAPDDLPVARPRLSPVHPNPFNPSTQISFEIGSRQKVEVGIYDVAGRLVTTLTRDVFPAGRHVLTWDGKDGRGHGVVSGVYFARLLVDGVPVESRKMLLLK